MRLQIRPLGALAIAALGSIATISAASAGAFAVREQSAYGQGASFAGVAAGGSLSSMFWNPATLSAIMGFEVELIGSGIFAASDVEATWPVAVSPPTDEGDIAGDVFVPAGYVAHRLGDRVVLGVGLNGRFGLVTEYDDASLMRTFGIAGTSDLYSVSVNPAIAVEVNDYLTIALGGVAQWFDAAFSHAATPPPLPAGTIATIEADGWGYGFTAGVLLVPMPGTEIGLGYRSAIDNDLSGEISILAPAPGTIPGIDTTLPLPDMVTFGVRHTLNDYFRVMAGIEWTNWSRFDTVTVDIGGGATLSLPFDYEDGWFYSLGGEYMHSDRLTLRAGVAWEETPISDAARTMRLPDGDRLWLSAGLSYVLDERFSFDFGYSYLKAFGGDVDNTNPQNAGLLAGIGGIATADVDGHVHIISAAIKAKFGGPKPESEPVVARY